ncbi:MAG: NB-ARC domain-containing protein, partial [Gammaproteobacteria bacterium]
ETELRHVLLDERHPVLTLVGRGGIGKTSLALSVLDGVSKDGTFFVILWVSARDIDLLPEGAKEVRPQVLTVVDIAEMCGHYLNPEIVRTKGFNAPEYLADILSSRDPEKAVLLVIDNFETVRNPSDVYTFVNNCVRLPNKVLITSRFREFKGDYPIHVGGMAEEEFEQVVQSTAERLQIEELLTPRYRSDLYNECDGHPYVAKILLGEVAKARELRKVERILATQEDILDALFERTFAHLNPGERRVFLTLCNWRSNVPKLALEAALLRKANERIEVSSSIDALERSSLVEVFVSPADGEVFLVVPLAAALFGQRKLAVSPLQSAIDADSRILHAFGASTNLAQGMKPRLKRLVTHIVEIAQRDKDGNTQEMIEILEYLARNYPPAWLSIADLSREGETGIDLPDEIGALMRYLEVSPDDADVWTRLARAYRRQGNTLGEINALLQLATRPKATYREVSDVANRFNTMCYEKALNIDTDEKREIASKLRNVMVVRINEASATDCSRLAWLCLHLGDTDSAMRHAEKGLALDPTNAHCVNLIAKLS